MSPVEWLRNGLGALVPRVWGRDCPRGVPVPEPGPCADCDALPLTELPEAESARVSCLLDPGGLVALRLAGAGILPGASVRVVQRWPSYVIRIGFSELALDREAASHVRVRRESAAEGA
jgi:DtxR family Mn-dependent transcriptional regulator